MLKPQYDLGDLLKVTPTLSGRVSIYTEARLASFPLCLCMSGLQRITGISCVLAYTFHSHSFHHPSAEVGQPPAAQRSPAESERTPEEAAGRAGGAGAADEGAPGCQREQAAGAGDCEEGEERGADAGPGPEGSLHRRSHSCLTSELWFY